MKTQLMAVLMSFLISAVPFHAAHAQSAPNLGSAGNFAVLAGTTVMCTGAMIAGDVGVNLGGSVGACTVNGTTHVGDSDAVQAYADFLAAYGALALLPCDLVLTGTLAGVTLPPGTYCFDAAATLTGVLTLDGDSDGIWIFKVGTGGTGALTGTNFGVVMSGANGCSNGVYWWSAQAATLTDSDFFGRLLAGTDLTVTRGRVKGQALAKGAVTLTGTSVLHDFCPIPEVSPSYAVFPALLDKNALSPTGYYLTFQRLDGLDGYNLYEGTLGSWYSHAGAAGSVCDVFVTDLGTTEMRASITPSEGNHYYLITAYNGAQEGPSGFNSAGAEIPAGRNMCAP